MIEDFQLLTSGVLESSTGSFGILFILSRAKSTNKEELSKCSVVKRFTSSCIPLTKPSYMVSTFNCWREDVLSPRLPRKQQRDWWAVGTSLHTPIHHQSLSAVACYVLYLCGLRTYFRISWKKFSLEVFVTLVCKLLGYLLYLGVFPLKMVLLCCYCYFL